MDGLINKYVRKLSLRQLSFFMFRQQSTFSKARGAPPSNPSPVEREAKLLISIQQ